MKQNKRDGKKTEEVKGIKDRKRKEIRKDDKVKANIIGKENIELRNRKSKNEQANIIV